MNNILTQNDGNNQLGIGSSHINLVGVANDSFDISQGSTSFMSFSTVSGSRKISVKKPITLNSNLLTIKSTAKIDSAPTNSLFYIDDNSELKTLGIGTTDEYLRMGFNRPAWGPKTFTETNISGIGSIGYLEELKIDDDKLIGIGSTLGVKDSSISNIIKYDTNRHISLIMSNNVGIGTLTIKTKYDTNFFDITLKKVDDDFSSNPSSKSLEIVDAKTYKYTINDLSNNSIHYYKLSINDINSFTTSNKKFHHITLRRDNTPPTASITSHIPTITNDNTPSFTFTTNSTGTLTTNISQGFTGGNDEINITTTGSHTITFDELPDAIYETKQVYLTDAAGNIATMNLNTFTIDVTGPTISIISHVPALTNDPTPSFTFQTDEVGTLTTNISNGFVDNQGNITTTNSNIEISFSTLLDDTYENNTLTFTDNAANSTIITLNDFTIDTIRPTTSITTHVPTTVSTLTPSFTFTTDKTGTLTTSITNGFADNQGNITTTGSHEITFSTLSETTFENTTLNFTDDAGNTILEPMTLNTFTISLDTTAPSITNYNPSHTGTLSSNSDNIILTFNENVTAGTGNIVLKQGDSTISTSFSCSGTTCTINPSSDLSNEGLTYNVEIDSTAIRDIAGNYFAGFSGTTYQINSKDITPPTDISFTISYYKRIGGVSVGIQESDSVSNEVWLAPAGTNSFSESSTMTQALYGTATSIVTPTSPGSYYLHIKDSADNINEISQELEVIVPTQNSGSYPGFMKDLYLMDNPSNKSILTNNNAGSNIYIQRSSNNKTYYSNVPINSYNSIGFSPSSTHKFYLTFTQNISPLDFDISIKKYSNGGFGSTTGGGNAGSNSTLTTYVSDEKRITDNASTFPDNHINYYKITVNLAGNLSASTFVEHYVALCRGERPHFMHYLNPFFNTSRPVYIKLYAWKLPSEEANITPHSQSEWQSHGGENAWYDSTHGGWLQCMHYGYSAYGMKMTNIYMYHSYRIMAKLCSYT